MYRPPSCSVTLAGPAPRPVPYAARAYTLDVAEAVVVVIFTVLRELLSVLLIEHHMHVVMEISHHIVVLDYVPNDIAVVSKSASLNSMQLESVCSFVMLK